MIPTSWLSRVGGTDGIDLGPRGCRKQLCLWVRSAPSVSGSKVPACAGGRVFTPLHRKLVPWAWRQASFQNHPLSAESFRLGEVLLSRGVLVWRVASRRQPRLFFPCCLPESRNQRRQRYCQCRIGQ